MTEKLQGIVLSAVRHSDRTLAVSVYTSTRGRLSLAVSTGSGKSARRIAALTMPLAQIEFECNLSANRELLRPRGIAFAYSYRDLYFSPVKNAIGIFLAEFLTKLLREAEPDRLIFRFISRSLIVLDTLGGSPANFHLTFLASLATFMGVAPDLETYTPGSLFDMRAGIYSRLHPGHKDILLGENARIPLLLSRLNYANMHRLRLNRTQREAILSGMLRYWSIHFPGLGTLHSAEVLSSLFT